jgi:hypothetical protein
LIGSCGNDGPEIRFFVRAGSDLVGEDVTEAINPNLAGVNDYSIYLAQVQFEYGQNASPFELNDKTTELNRCKRYYQTTNVNTPFRGVTTGSASIASDPDSILILSSGKYDVRYPIDIRNGASSTVDIKEDGTASFATPVKSNKGFRGTRTGVGERFINYQVESEL